MLAAVLLFCCTLWAYRDFEQVWIFDDPENLSLIFAAPEPSMYFYHAMVNGTPHIQFRPAVEWVYGWQRAELEQSGYIGFRTDVPEPMVNPVYCDVEPQIPATTQLCTDPLNDHLFNESLLDIIEYRAVFTADRIYLAMKTSAPDYITSSGMTYYAYMPILLDPAADIEDDPIVYGLMYTVDMDPIISPGLYKISGSGLSGLSRIGDIEYSIQENFLVLSCAIDDLLADVDLAAWFDPEYPLFSTAATTSRITLVNGIQQADMTDGAKVLFKPHYVEAVNNSSPVLSNPFFVLTGSYLTASIDYQDADANVPHLATISIDGAEPYPLLPMSTDDLDFHTPVTYSAQEIPLAPDWQSLTFSFSDGTDFVHYVYDNPASSTMDATQNPMPELQLYPNPVRESLQIKMDQPAKLKLGIYNIRGQKVSELLLQGKDTDFDLSALAPGIYILQGPGIKSRRMVKL